MDSIICPINLFTGQSIYYYFISFPPFMLHAMLYAFIYVNSLVLSKNKGLDHESLKMEKHKSIMFNPTNSHFHF